MRLAWLDLLRMKMAAMVLAVVYTRTLYCIYEAVILKRKLQMIQLIYIYIV